MQELGLEEAAAVFFLHSTGFFRGEELGGGEYADGTGAFDG
jgi:hypothetical protein